jgi:hypothetical protein
MGQKDPEKLYWEREPEVLIAGIYTSVSGYIFQHHRIAKHAKPCLRSGCFLLEEQQSSNHLIITIGYVGKHSVLGYFIGAMPLCKSIIGRQENILEESSVFSKGISWDI